MFVAILSGDVEVVGLDDYLRVDPRKSLFGCLHLWKAYLRGSEKETVHVGKLNLVIIVEDKFSDSATSEHFSCNWANTSYSDN